MVIFKRFFYIVLFLFSASSLSAPIIFGTGDKLSNDSTEASFNGEIELIGNDLIISLENTSPNLNGGFLTAIAFNDPGVDLTPAPTLSSVQSTLDGIAFTDASSRFDLLGGSTFSNSIDTNPADPFDIGAASTNSWLAGGSPNEGIAIGETVVFTFSFAGVNVLTTQDFLDTLNGDSNNSPKDNQWLAVRFRGFGDGGSSKYGGGNPDTPPDTTGDTNGVPVPPAVWLFGTGLIGMLGFNRKKA